MEIILSSVGLVLSPFLIKWITAGVKKVLGATYWRDGNRAIFLRGLVTVLSFGAVVGTALLNGTEVDATTIQQFADTLTETILVGTSATGFYFWSKHKEVK